MGMGARGGVEMKKGPWKEEEDEVLRTHVEKNGPKDWSSIRSKGLLRRTGKSCRLRWVNKLRPNLKSGVKFSGEEERVVIELQAQFGNRWARIARFLPGRTDNDVKNFWSSRQKRLKRILHRNPHTNDEPLSILEAPMMEESSSNKIQSCSSSSSFHELIHIQDQMNPNLDAAWRDMNSPSGLDYSFSSLTQEVAATLEDPNYLEVLAPINLPSPPGYGGSLLTVDLEETMAPDSFFDDFQIDMFDPPPAAWY